jgi:hypothetical protein
MASIYTINSLEVPKLSVQLDSGNSGSGKKSFVVIYNEDIKDLNIFQSHGRCLFYEPWLQDPLDSIVFDYFLIDTRKEGAFEYLKCQRLENYNVIYYTSDKKIHAKLTEKFQKYDNINVISSIPNHQFKENFERLLMFGASVKDLVLDENFQKTAKSLFKCFSRK